jgi:hypothetical protein
MPSHHVKDAAIDPMFYDLDAMQCVMLHSIFLRARERFAHVISLGLARDNDDDMFTFELIALEVAAYEAAIKRTASISKSREYFISLPTRSEWQHAVMEPLF